MPTWDEIAAVVLPVFIPTGITGFALALPKFAGWMEKDASDNALKYIAAILSNEKIADFGKVVVAIVPYIFDKIFGKNPLSLRFVTSSICVTTLFWLTLVMLKHGVHVHSVLNFNKPAKAVVPYSLYLSVDLISLWKSKYLLGVMSKKSATSSAILFVILDLAISFMLPLPYVVTLSLISTGEISDTLSFINNYAEFATYYFYNSTLDGLDRVLVPSTMLTSVWTVFLFVAAALAKFLLGIDKLRRFTMWWFKDVEKHPLTIMAKVSSVIIILATFMTKAIQWSMA